MLKLPIPSVIETKDGRRVGDRWLFAVEFEIRRTPLVPRWNECWGSLWMWIEGHVVGKPYETEMVFTGLGSLLDSANQGRSEASSIIAAYSPEQALKSVMRACYGDDDPPNAISVKREDLTPL